MTASLVSSRLVLYDNKELFSCLSATSMSPPPSVRLGFLTDTKLKNNFSILKLKMGVQDSGAHAVKVEAGRRQENLE